MQLLPFSVSTLRHCCDSVLGTGSAPHFTQNREAVTASGTPDGLYVNVRSEECSIEPSSVPTDRGLRVVTYRGEEHVVVGLYFARGPHGRREPRLILGRVQRTPDMPGKP
jgi:hypothetical protein